MSTKTTYQSFYKRHNSNNHHPHQPTSARGINKKNEAAISFHIKYNDPQANYDDPARPKPPFISRLQPLSFTSSMAPERVAQCPVPLSYNPTTIETERNQAVAKEAAKFSTTSLESIHRSLRDENNRLGMSGVESFRFALRADTGSFTSRPDIRGYAHPHPEQQALHQQQQQQQQQQQSTPSAAVAAASAVSTSSRGIPASVTAHLPRSAFFYHCNHTQGMAHMNNAARKFKSPMNSSIILTQVVQPRPHPPADARFLAGNTAVTAQNQLFPYAYNVGHMINTSRPHAYDLRAGAAPLAPPQYAAFPLAPAQSQHAFVPTDAPAEKLAFDNDYGRFRSSKTGQIYANPQAF